MGSRGPIGTPHGRRAEQRAKALRLVLKPSGPPPKARERPIAIRMSRTVRADPGARRFWKAHARVLVELGRLEMEHATVFGRLCLLHGRIERFAATIAREGEIVEGPRGGRTKHPLLTPMRQAETLFAQLAGRFGLDPLNSQRFPKTAEYCSRRERLLQEDAWSLLARPGGK